MDCGDDFLSAEVAAFGASSSASTCAGRADELDDEQELDRLLAYAGGGNLSSASTSPTAAKKFEGFNEHVITVDEPTDLDLYVRREGVRGVDRIKSQLAQAATVFRDFANIVSEDGERLDLLGAGVESTSERTIGALKEIRKAHRSVQRARRNRLICWGAVLAIIGTCILHWNVLPRPSSDSSKVVVSSSPTSFLSAGDTSDIAFVRGNEALGPIYRG